MSADAGTYRLQGVPADLYWAERLARAAAAVARAADQAHCEDGGSGCNFDHVAYLLDGIVVLCDLSAAITEQLFEAETSGPVVAGRAELRSPPA